MYTNQILELLKYIIPSIVIFAGTYLIMSNFFTNQWKEKSFEMKGKELELKNKELAERNKVVLPIKLQAYERLIIFLERINPNSSIQRVRQPGMTANDLQLALVSNIRAEFEHNTAQQLYISIEAWQLVKTVKEEMIKLYNLIGSNMPKDAMALDYSRAILEYLLNTDKDLPTDTAIKFLKDDAAKFLS
ncbi:MAG: hypothetical protein R2728_14240 [Chitinophagales bacterium]